MRKNSSNNTSNHAALAEIALEAIHDGVVMTDKNGVIQFINPAAVNMTECGSADKAIGLDCGLIIKLESKEGRELPDNENPLVQAMKTGQPLDSAQVSLIAGQSAKRIPIAISVLSSEGTSSNRIITFRNITKELEEEGEQTEFISTASHEMRTPVATIDGYLSLCLNPQTATLDDRARGYLTAAQIASKHLGKLFQDLLDATKLDDGKIRPHFEPVEMVSLVKKISDDYTVRAEEANLNFSFGSNNTASFGDGHHMEQVVYGFVDINFMREILDNLIENAIKYTPAGGSIYVNVRGDGDRVLVNVTDTGIGISSDDLSHIFQKFYRADNSDTREIGGTGLGLYLVKQRVEAMGGKVWAESAFGEGSTFFVSLPRLSSDEYEKRMIVVQNQKIQNQINPTPQPVANVQAFAAAAQPNAQPMPQPTAQPTTQLATQLTTKPVAKPAPQPSVQSVAKSVPQPASQPTAQPVSPPKVTPQPAPPGHATSPNVAAPPAPQPATQPSQTNNNLNGEKR